MRACLLAHRTAGSRAWLLRDGELLWFSVSCSDMRVPLLQVSLLKNPSDRSNSVSPSPATTMSPFFFCDSALAGAALRRPLAGQLVVLPPRHLFGFVRPGLCRLVVVAHRLCVVDADSSC